MNSVLTIVNDFRKHSELVLENPFIPIESFVTDRYWLNEMIKKNIISRRYVNEDIWKSYPALCSLRNLVLNQPLSNKFIDERFFKSSMEEIEILIELIENQKLCRAQRDNIKKRFRSDQIKILFLLHQELDDDEIFDIAMPEINSIRANRENLTEIVNLIKRDEQILMPIARNQKLAFNILKIFGREYVLACGNTLFEVQRYSCADLDQIICLVRNSPQPQIFGKVIENDINWTLICTYQDLSEEFIVRYRDCVDWKKVVEHQKLSVNFLCRYSAHIDFFLFFSTNKFITREILNVLLKRCYLQSLRLNKYFLRTEDIRAILEIDVDSFKPFPPTWHVTKYQTRSSLQELSRQNILGESFNKQIRLNQENMYSRTITPSNIVQYGYNYYDMISNDEGELFPVEKNYITDLLKTTQITLDVLFKWCTCSENLLREIVTYFNVGIYHWLEIVKYQKLSSDFILTYFDKLTIHKYNIFAHQRLSPDIFDNLKVKSLWNRLFNCKTFTSYQIDKKYPCVLRTQFVPNNLVSLIILNKNCPEKLQEHIIKYQKLSFIDLSHVISNHSDGHKIRQTIFACQQPFSIDDIDFVKNLVFTEKAINIFDQQTAQALCNLIFIQGINFEIKYYERYQFKILNKLDLDREDFDFDADMAYLTRDRIPFHPFIPNELFDLFPEVFFFDGLDQIILSRNLRPDFIKKWYALLKKDDLLGNQFLNEELIEILLNKNSNVEWKILFSNVNILSQLKRMIAAKYNKKLPVFLR